jgi:hypothetical protein
MVAVAALTEVRMGYILTSLAQRCPARLAMGEEASAGSTAPHAFDIHLHLHLGKAELGAGEATSVVGPAETWPDVEGMPLLPFLPSGEAQVVPW